MFSRFSILVLCLCCACVSAKLCPSMDIRSNISQFDNLKNCTKIVGYLKVVLFQNETTYPRTTEPNDVFPSFPELREVTGYVLVFWVPNLYDLGILFPNLVVIRGKLLLKGNSFIVHHNNQIQQIGLSNLREIQRGYVQIGKCPKLCYVHTVNWTSLGTSLANYAEIADCKHEEECAPDCKGNCWAPGKCQKQFENCHPECLGCEKPGSAKHCLVCKNWKDGDTCVKECPAGKLRNDEILECVTKEQCTSIDLPGGYWVFKNSCLPVGECPDKYEVVNSTNSYSKTCQLCKGVCNKTCNGISVETLEQIEQLKGCTRIKEHLEIRIKDIYLVNQLTENLGNITEIEGCLKVARSDAISSLKFFSKLKRIGGKNKQTQCNNHTIYMYGNPNLRTLIDVPKIMTADDVSIGFHDNPELCLSEIQKFATALGIEKSRFDSIIKEAKDVSPYSNGDMAPCADLTLPVSIVENNPTNITLKWEHFNAENTNVIGYTIYYILDKLSRGENSHHASSNMCNNKGWNNRFISNNAIQLIDLSPFTTYVYWIRVYNISGVLGSTEQKNFTTVPDDPTKPVSFELNAISPTSLNMSWYAPEYTNGELSHYHVIAFVEKDDPKFVRRRNYCIYPHVDEVIKKTEPVKIPMKKWINQTENGTCVCQPNIFKLNDTFCGPSNTFPTFSNQECNKYMYQIIENRMRKKITKRYLLEAKSGERFNPSETAIDIYFPASRTNYILKNLMPFTAYILLFSACNKNFKGKPLCSAAVFSSARTKANRTADRIKDLDLKIIQDDAVALSWVDPPNPNGMIVAYNVEYKSADNSKSVYVPDCLTRTQHEKSGLVYKIQGMDPGIYTIRVKPVSLHGPGIYSRSIKFQIKSPFKTWVIYLLVCVVFVICVIIILMYWRYKQKIKKHNLNMLLVSNINPDYQTAIYIDENWELDRDDIEINEALGQGSFGLVFHGYIKSMKLPCAVKTVNESATPSYRSEFLKEAYVMKSFCEAQHVVKLFGIVSRDSPPLVIMELMERGDLKQYLRNARDSSQSISSPEMYQMAAQIADGMAYLAAKKFVHRDLAARNCLVAGDRTVKIGDFGMTKDIYETDYYRKDTNGLLPVRWMSPESLADGIFSTESDVWSFGIVLWEIVTLAEHPYQGMSNDQVVKFIINRGRLGRPPECPDVLWEIMDVCWSRRSKERPLFIGIVEKLEPLAGPSFALVSFYHSRLGREYRLNYRQRELNDNPINRPDSYDHNSYTLEDDDDMLMSQDDDLYSSNPKILKRRSGGRKSSSWQPSSYSISDPTP